MAPHTPPTLAKSSAPWALIGGRGRSLLGGPFQEPYIRIFKMFLARCWGLCSCGVVGPSVAIPLSRASPALSRAPSSMTKRMTAGDTMSKIIAELATDHPDVKKVRRIFMMTAQYVVTNIDDTVDRLQENRHPCIREVQIGERSIPTCSAPYPVNFAHPPARVLFPGGPQEATPATSSSGHGKAKQWPKKKAKP